jgi:hypothetical protein
MVFTNTHLSHPQVPEFFLLQLNYILRDMAGLEISNKIIPSDRRSIARTCSLV